MLQHFIIHGIHKMLDIKILYNYIVNISKKYDFCHKNRNNLSRVNVKENKRYKYMNLKYCISIVSILIVLSGLQLKVNAAAPSKQTTKITFSNVSSNVFSINWTRGNGSKCAVFVKQTTTGTASPVNKKTYTANTAFGLGTQIGTSKWYCVYNGTGTNVSVTGLIAGRTYRVMVCEYNGTTGSQEYLTSSATNNPNNQMPDYTAPVTQASGVNFTNLTSTSFTANWTRGNGSNCIVFAQKTSSSTTASPVNNVTYTANAKFGKGSQIGSTGWYCVYNGTSKLVTVSGLTTGSTYRIMVIEYNGIASLEKYLKTSATNNPANQIADYTAPSKQTSNIVFSNIGTTGYTVSWTRGNGSQCILFAKKASSGIPSPVNNTIYAANSTFSKGSQISSSGWYCLYKGTGKSVSISGLTSGTAYQFMVCELNGANGFEKYMTASVTSNPKSQTSEYIAPATQASNLNITNVTANNFDLSWTRGNGSNCIVFIAQSPASSFSLANNTSYTANSTFKSGSQIGTSGWYCVYSGNGTSVSINGLSAATTYQTIVCEYNGTTGKEKYNTTLSIQNSKTQKTTSTTTWNGTAWSNGKPVAEANAIINGNLVLAENIACNELTINKGFTLTINPGYCLIVNSTLTNNGNFTLKSPLTEAASGTLLNYGIIVNNGTMTAERYITSGTSLSSSKVWHNMSSPVNSFKVEKSFFSDYVSQYVESTNGWKALVSKNMIDPTTGYIVKTIQTGGKTINFSGTFNTGNQSLALTNTGADASHGYNLVGNPYPSAIDWEASTGWTKTNVSRTIWIWNPYTQVYSTWDGTVGTNGGSRYIPAMQGFIVKVNEGYTSGTLAMNNNVRVYNTKSYSKKAKTEPELIRLKTSGNELSDELIVYKSDVEGSTEKMFSTSSYVPQISAVNSIGNYSIVKLAEAITDTAIELSFRCDTSGTYTISAEDMSFNNVTSNIYLIDRIEGKTIKLESGTSYTFYHDAKTESKRFALKLSGVDEKNTTNIASQSESEFNVWSYNKKVMADIKEDGEFTLEVYYLSGVMVAQKNINQRGINSLQVSQKGVYIVKLKNTEIVKTKKVIIK